MTLTDFKQQFINALSISDKTQINALLTIGRNSIKNPELNKQWFIQTINYNQASRDYYNLGIISRSDFKLDTNQANFAFTKIIENLAKDDWVFNFAKTNNLPKILILCYNTITKNEIQDFVQRTGMKNTTAEVSVDKTVNFEHRKYSLIIFDNRFIQKSTSNATIKTHNASDEKVARQRIRQMRAYLDARKSKDLPQTYFLHFGEELYLLNKEREYRQYIHAANSFFSLYARIIEVLEFIKIYDDLS